MAERRDLPDLISGLGVGQVEFRSKLDKSLTEIREESGKDLRSKLSRDRSDNPGRFGILDGLKRFLGTNVTSKDLDQSNNDRTVAHMNDDE